MLELDWASDIAILGTSSGNLIGRSSEHLDCICICVWQAGTIGFHDAEVDVGPEDVVVCWIESRTSMYVSSPSQELTQLDKYACRFPGCEGPSVE